MAIINPLRYDNPDDVRTRLNNSIFFYNGNPVYAVNKEQREDLQIKVFPLRKPILDKGFLIHSSDDAIDLSSKPLGWVNFKFCSIYVARTPARKPLQGIGNSNLVAYSTKGESLRMVDYNIVVPEFADMLLGIYPSMEDAIRDSSENECKRSCPFHRDMAIIYEDKMYKILFKTECVGVFNNKKDGFVIPYSKEYFLPFLHDLNVPCFPQE